MYHYSNQFDFCLIMRYIRCLACNRDKKNDWPKLVAKDINNIFWAKIENNRQLI